MRRPEHTFKGGAGVSCVTGFFSLIAILEKHYGRPKPALARGPFELILYENIAYLVSEDRREKAFRELKARIGTRPEDLLVASIEELAKITALGGIFPELRAKRLQESALLVRDDFGGDHTFFHGFVGQHRLASHITDRKNVTVGGAQTFVYLNPSERIGHPSHRKI